METGSVCGAGWNSHIASRARLIWSAATLKMKVGGRKREALRRPDRRADPHALAQHEARADRRLSAAYARSRSRVGDRGADREPGLSGGEGGDGTRLARVAGRRGAVPPVAAFRW